MRSFQKSGSASVPLSAPPGLGLYVHFPWCVKKCPYCDFNSHPLTGDLREGAYIRALEQEFRARVAVPGHNPAQRFDSVFLGGGTPSLFSADAIGSLVELIRPWLRTDAEITLEVNPGTVERGDLGAYHDAGINRLSIGAQSFSSQCLKRLGRIHSPGETRACFADARRGGFDNINLDIMYGLPGQATKAALADLEAAIALSPEHLSWYQLTIEPKTEFARRPPSNLPGEAAICEMEAAGYALLERAGLRRYEISAYARPSAVCRHNLIYWTFGDYLGLGAGAHGKQGVASNVAARPLPDPAQSHPSETPPTIRTHNPRQPRLYLQDPCHTDRVLVSAADLPGEFMMNTLRLVGGVERHLFEARTGLPWSTVAPIWQETTALGLTEPNRIAATPFGLKHLDTLVQYFLPQSIR